MQSGGQRAGDTLRPTWKALATHVVSDVNDLVLHGGGQIDAELQHLRLGGGLSGTLQHADQK